MVLPRFARAAVAFFSILVCAYLYGALLHPMERRPAHPYFERPGPWVVAHRGGRALAPENTLEAFRRAEALGVDVLEMDLRSSADDVLVLMHDPTVDRTTDRSGRVDDMTLEELQDLDAGYRFEGPDGGFPFRNRGITVPSFAQLLAEFPHRLLNAEMKELTPDAARRLCRLIEEHDAGARILISSFDHGSMTAFREACPAVATGATRREALTLYVLRRVGLPRFFRSPAAALQLPPTFRGREVVTPGLVAFAQETNRPVQVWTINETEEMERLLSRGVQAILTDRPDRLLTLLGRSGPPASASVAPASSPQS